MLDQTTKQRINACRDILVGKVPDPKSQVEQITIALIYKFMDDMDRESVEMGGKASFFSGEYAQYSWRAIFDPRIGGHELIKLYSEAIEKMNQNSQIPQLFRDIFNNAYLPYRDPETLKLFLKEINNFDYGNSERLGDAFEYLLSFMGTQGDAGQFRTPRHIIDFIAEVVNPKKNETVLDPACGTAGFLISAYKHIIKQNDDGKSLTPDERKRLIKNFIGYDISPDMVRLSLVNLYLHGFQDPNIFEYDTLTSEERWDDTVDVVLANPPFMTPKGGIRPHKRFSVQANKSEVLFIDYIAEHLNPGGRAGIIVPEGIIFQSSNAYKALRKMLIDDYLWAVVSLPAGVFNPYSGVKTSILFLDKQKAKENDSILFTKIENDGFDLGAQRRPIDKNDLPEALQILHSGDADNTELAHWVEKSKIEESGDWNLSGERYRDTVEIQTDWDLVELSEVLEYEQPTKYIVESTDYDDSFKIPVLTAGKSFLLGYTHEIDGVFAREKLPVIIFDDFTTATKFVDFPFKVKSSAMKILHPKRDKALPEFIYYTMQNMNFKVNEHKRHWISQYSKLQIPLPPLSVQEEIVAEIDGYQKIIDGARQVVDNYKPTIKINPDWEMVELGEVCDKITDGTHDTPKPVDKGIRFITAKHVKDKIDFDNCYYLPEDVHKTIYSRCNPEFGDVLVVNIGAGCGISALVNVDFEFSMKNVALLKTSKDLSSGFVHYYLQENRENIYQTVTQGGAQAFLSLKTLKNLIIPLPPLSIQQGIVAQIEAEQEMVNANKKLIEIYEHKVKDKIGEVWGE
jgi:type I restriction enzyme M protein